MTPSSGDPVGEPRTPPLFLGIPAPLFYSLVAAAFLVPLWLSARRLRLQR